MNKKGHTLVELLVYMVLGVIVLGFSIQAMKDISTGYVRGREVTKMQSNGRDAINLLARDLANTGFKYYIFKDTTSTSGNDTVTYELRPSKTSVDSLFLLGSYTSKYIDLSGSLPKDSASSFFERSGAISDTLELFRSRLVSADSVGSIERVKFYVGDNKLWRISRECTNRSLVGGVIDWKIADTIAVIENAKGLQFQYSTDGFNWINSPSSSVVRDSIKHIRVALLIASSRESDIVDPMDSVILGDVKIGKEDGYLYRTYEQVVTIHNNGIVR